jgi:hypothetical protein
MKPRRLAAGLVVLLAALGAGAPASAHGRSGGKSMGSTEQPSQPPNRIASVSEAEEAARKYFAAHPDTPMTPEEMAAAEKWTRDHSSGVVDYYPDAPEDPDMTPPPLDRNGNPIRSKK